MAIDRDTVIRMAMESDMTAHVGASLPTWTCSLFDLERFASLIEAEAQGQAAALLRRMDAALRLAWAAGTLPASVIPSELAREVGQFLELVDSAAIRNLKEK